MDDVSAVTTSIGTDCRYEESRPGLRPNARSWLAMYSDARRPPRVAGARPSSRSELRKRRWPSISAVEMWVEAWAAASAGVTESTVASSERRVGIGALRSWENGGQYIATSAQCK